MRDMWLLKLEIRTLCMLVLVVGAATACSSHKDSDESGQSEDDGGTASGRGGSNRAGAGGRSATGGRTASGEAGRGDDDEKPDDQEGPKGGNSAGGSKAPDMPDVKDAGAGDEEDDAGPAQGTATGLRKAADDAKRLIGAAVEPDQLAMEQYGKLAADEYNALMPASGLKWVNLEATRGQWWWEPGDQIVAATITANQKLRGHTLVGYAQAPEWAAPLMGAELAAELQNHIRATVTHFKGKIYGWDVFNDAIDENTNQLRPGLYTNLGIEGLANLFKWAKEADPDAQLYYDDYGIEGPGPKTDAVLKLLSDLKAAGAPIDGVGIQAHLDTTGYPSEAAVRATLKRFAAVVPVVSYTELDVKTKSADPMGDAARRNAAQRLPYQIIAGVCATEDACRGITTWGISDKFAATPSDEALPFDADFKKKPAYEGLVAGFNKKLPTLTGNDVLANSNFETGAVNWVAFGGGELVVQNTTAKNGSAAAVSGRTEAFQGAAQSLLGKVKDEDGMCFTAQVRVSSPTSIVTASLKVDPGTNMGMDTSYRVLATAYANNTDWVELSGCGPVHIPDGATDVTLYISGPAAGVTLYMDDASFKKLTY
jgi:endo-1,4-beta-xylanase